MLLRQALWFILLSCCSSIDFSDEMITRYREKVREMFYHAYNGYLNHAFPLDELKPISCKGQDTWGSFSLSLVDALDTLIVMGNTSEFKRAVDLVLKSVRTDANVNVSVFETNIRIVGGLLSAHMLSGRVEGMVLEDGWPCSGPLLRLAEAMAARLLPAFNTETGMPYGTVNLKYGVPKRETPITCTAAVGTIIVEFGTLSRLTGDPRYERVALRALESLWRTRSSIGLVGNHINIRTGQWTATDTGIGAGVDSYFEYLVKGALLLQRPALMEQFREYQTAINRYVRKGDWFLWVNMSKGTVSLPIFQSLEAFWPGLLAMIGEVEDASRIMLQYSQVVRQYGFPPEFYNIQNAASEKRSAFPLRPELVESLMYLYRATEDPHYLEIGAQVVDAIEHSAKTSCGYATINNVNDHSIEDRMESFFLAETTKYLYLLFDHKNFIHNDGLKARIVDTPNGECVIYAGGYIFNTEAHPVDPAIVHCCSAQRQAEREAVRKWEDHYDFLSILDHRPDSTDHSEFPKETLPEFLAGLKKITEDPDYLKSSGSGSGSSVEQLEEIEFEIDESLLKNDSSNFVELRIEDGSSEIGSAVEEQSSETSEVDGISAEKSDSAVYTEDLEVDGTVEEKPVDDPSNHDSLKVETKNTESENASYSQGEKTNSVVEKTSGDGSSSQTISEEETQNSGEHTDAERADVAATKQREKQSEDQQKSREKSDDDGHTVEEVRLENSAQNPQPPLESPQEISTTIQPMPPFVGHVPPGAFIVPSVPPVKGSTVRAWKTKMTQKDLLKKIRSLIHQARLHDEEKLEQGEMSNSADRLVSTMMKIHSDYADLIKEAKELDDEYFEELKLRAERTKMAAMIPVVTAVCVKCCYATEEIGESASFRQWMNTVYKIHIFPKRRMNLALGPLCWPYEEPRVEDNYHNVAPEVSPDTWLPGDVPVEVFYNLRSLTNFEVSDATDYKFDLLLTPPLGFRSKFIGVGQVALPTNQTWAH